MNVDGGSSRGVFCPSISSSWPPYRLPQSRKKSKSYLQVHKVASPTTIQFWARCTFCDFYSVCVYFARGPCGNVSCRKQKSRWVAGPHRHRTRNLKTSLCARCQPKSRPNTSWGLPVFLLTSPEPKKVSCLTATTWGPCSQRERDGDLVRCDK